MSSGAPIQRLVSMSAEAARASSLGGATRLSMIGVFTSPGRRQGTAVEESHQPSQP